MTSRVVSPTAEHLAFRTEAIALLKKHSGHLQSHEMLAMAAHLIGQIIAMQDQRTMTRDRALAILVANIERGNEEVIANLSATRGAA